MSNALCKKTEFTCNSGQCINEFSACDGNSDCYDGSDETITQCINVRCPAFSFQCAYGACVDKSKKCDGIEDCKDGSDEDPELCLPQVSSTTATTLRPTTSIRPSIDGGCVLPDKPQGGDYIVLDCEEGNTTPKCRRVPGTVVRDNTIIRFSCHDGYVLPEKVRNSFCYRGAWEPEPPACQKLCHGLHSDTLDLSCFYLGNPVNCNQTARPGTRVKAHCKPAYHESDSAAVFTDIECLNDGKWSTQLFTCIPDCGIKNINVQQLIVHGSTADGEYPWHAALFKGPDHFYFCGGTIVTPKAILTAAHCVYNETLNKVIRPSEVYVAVGKFHRSWDIRDNNEQRFRVLEILIPDTYLGKNNRYEHDIAVLAIEGTIAIKPSVMPVCIDKLGTFQLYRRPTALGTVVGWGKTERGTVSDVLRIGKFPFYDFHSCRERVSSDFSFFITYDKFCAGLSNGTTLGQGDSGGGLTFTTTHSVHEMHFIYGIVSIKDSSNDAIAVFTNVTVHLEWLDKVFLAIRKSRS